MRTTHGLCRACTPYLCVLDELLPAACHVTEQSTNNPIEADHGQLKIPTVADARTQTAARSASHQRWTRRRPEPPPRPLRARHGCRPEAPASSGTGFQRPGSRALSQHSTPTAVPAGIGSTHHRPEACTVAGSCFFLVERFGEILGSPMTRGASGLIVGRLCYPVRR